MEPNNTNTGITSHERRSACRNSNPAGRLWGGLLVVVFGVLLLARQLDLGVPNWIFSFEAILIIIGLYIGLRHSFRGFFWLIPILIGGFLLLEDLYPLYELKRFTWPLLVIALGLFIMLRANKRKQRGNPHHRGVEAPVEESSDDVLDSTVVFGGAKKHIISKNFRGGEAVTVFGGTELNLMQAELTSPAVLELVQVFGGTKLIVPSHWRVQSKEMVAILGGIDDKRPVAHNANPDPNHVLILKGTCLMGGIEIKSF